MKVTLLPFELESLGMIEDKASPCLEESGSRSINENQTCFLDGLVRIV